MLLNDNPRFKIQEDQMKPVAQAFVWVDDIVTIVSQSEDKLKGERTDIENGLLDQVKSFQKDLDDVKEECNKFKDNN